MLADEVAAQAKIPRRHGRRVLCLRESPRDQAAGLAARKGGGANSTRRAVAVPLPVAKAGARRR